MYAFRSNVILDQNCLKEHAQCSEKSKKSEIYYSVQPNRVNCTTVQNYQLFFIAALKKEFFFEGSFGKNLTSDNILWWVGSITAIRMA